MHQPSVPPPQWGIDYTHSLPDECLALIFNYLTTTNDRNNSLPDKCLEMITVSALSSLQVLHLEKLVYCTNTGLICVVEHCKYLQKLYIDNRMWNEIGHEALFAIAKYCLNLEELVLIGVDACCISLEAIVVNFRKLERLDLCKSKAITDVEISYIAEKCVALKKLLIKKCCVSDKGIEAFAMGCSTLVEIRVTKCENVTHEVKDRLRARRGSLVIKLDTVKTKAGNAIIGESGAQELLIVNLYFGLNGSN